MAAVASEVDAQNFHRVISLLIDEGSRVLRKLLMKYVQPLPLDQYLANHKTTLETLQNKKHVLHQAQMDLLFPVSGNGADLEMFDITLLSCLLKNICGKLPPQEKKAIEELRNTRNEVSGHMPKAAINSHGFKTLWNKISYVINNLASSCNDAAFAQDMYSTITHLWMNPKLVPSNQLSALRHQLQQWENDEKRHTSRNLKKVSKQFLLSNTRNQYVHTQLMDEVLNQLQITGSCVISGKPGEGKTMAASTILKNNFDAEKCLVLSHPLDWMAVDIDETDAIFIDDIFGIYQLDEGIMRSWLQVLDKVSTACVESQGRFKVIIATRANIFKECSGKVARFSVFDNVVEFTSDKLLEKEKKEILYLTLQHNKKTLSPGEIRNCVSNFTSPIGFPFCCHLFSTDTSLFDHGATFFARPYKFFKDNLKTLEKTQFVSLAFLFYHKGNVKISELLENKEDHCAELRDITSSLGMQQSILPSAVRWHLNQMKDMYVTYDQGCAKFVHNTVAETVGLLYGNHNIVHVLRACSSDFLHQCLVLKLDQQDDIEEKVEKLFMQRDYDNVLVERLINEVVDVQEVERTAAHQALLDLTFLRAFVQKVNSKKCEQTFFTTNDIKGMFHSGRHFLPAFARSISNNKQTTTNYLSVFLNAFNKCAVFSSKGCWKCEVWYDCLNECCSLGEKEASLLLLEYGIKPDTESAFKAVEGRNFDIVRAVLDHGAIPDTETVRCAVQGGNLEMVMALIRAGAVPDADCLNLAVQGGAVDMVISVLEQGVKSNTSNVNYAARTGSADIVCALLAYGGVPEVKTMEMAIWGNDAHTVRVLVDYGGIIVDNETVNCAVRGGNIDIVNVVLNYGAQPDIWTLKCAVERGNVYIVRAVMDHEVEPDTETLNLAVHGGNVEIVRTLLEHEATQPSVDILYWAVQDGNADVVKEIMEHGVVPNIDMVSCALLGGNTDILRSVVEHESILNTKTLNCEVVSGSVDIVKTLLAHGARPDKTTIENAVYRGDFEIFRTVEAHGSAEMHHMKKLLSCAIMGGSVEIVKAAIEYGAEPDTRNLYYSLSGKKMDIVKVLIEHGVVPDSNLIDLAITKGELHMVKKAMELGAVPDCGNVYHAVEESSVDIVTRILEHGPPADEEAVHLAVLRGNDEMISALMEHGAFPSIETVNIAVREGNGDVINALVRNGAIPDRKILQDEFETEDGNLETIKAMLEHGTGASTEIVDAAITSGKVDKVREVIGLGALPNRENLSHAIERGYVDIAEVLIENGVLPDADTVDLAVQSGKMGVIRTVLGHGAVPDTETVKYAVREGNVGIVNVLMEHGAVPDEVTLNCALRGGNVCIMDAVMEHGYVPDIDTINCLAEEGKVDVVTAVLMHGVWLNAETVNCAVRSGSIDMVKLVLEYGAIPDSDSMYYAVQGGHINIIKIVMEYGANPDIRTILSYAVQFGDTDDVIKAVEEHGALPDTESLNCAVRGGKADTIRYLLARGATTNKDTLTFALLQEDTDVIKAIMEKGYVPDLEMLNEAVERGATQDVITSVVEHGRIDPNTRMLNSAVQRGDIDIVKAVMEYGALPDTSTLQMALQGDHADVISLITKHVEVPN